MIQSKTFNPKGQPLTFDQLTDLATIRQSDVDEMVKRTHKSLKPLLDAVAHGGNPQDRAASLIDAVPVR
ncbi:MAG: hypothetical protein ACYT04_63930 [Nostoc sp.]